MPLSRDEIEKIEQIVESSRLTEVRIERDGEVLVIGGAETAAPAVSAAHVAELVAVEASIAGTVCLEPDQSGSHVAAGDALAQIRVLDAETPVLAPTDGRVVAVTAEDGALVAYGQDLFLIDPASAQ